MVPSPQVPTLESRGDGADVPKTGWREKMFDAALASQSALGWGLSLWRCGRCVASHSALDWGDLLLSVAGRCLGGQSVRAWLGTVARWRVSPRLVGDCRYMARQSAFGWGLSRGGQSVRAWLGTVAMWRASMGTFALVFNVGLLSLLWSVSPFGGVLPLE
ncbi:hypothetical protein ACLB2K_031051 [Fragaria x ananassa]